MYRPLTGHMLDDLDTCRGIAFDPLFIKAVVEYLVEPPISVGPADVLYIGSRMNKNLSYDFAEWLLDMNNVSKSHMKERIWKGYYYKYQTKLKKQTSMVINDKELEEVNDI